MKALGVTFLVVSLAITAMAQTFRGGIQGTISDSTGAAIPGAEITAASEETGLIRTTHSGASGDYSLPELPVGLYTVTAKANGFNAIALKAIKVVVSANQQADFQLTPGTVSTSIDVTAPVALVDTIQDTLGGTMEAEDIRQLPIAGRDFNKLLVMVPGSQGDASGESDSAGSFGLFSINGNRGRSNTYLLDGTDMNDGYRNLPAINAPGVFGTPVTILPLDALQEVSVSSGTEAEFGRTSGATVNMVTKSGSNQIHGSVYEYFRNNGLDARNAFNTADQQQNLFHNNQYGFSLGGPLIKNKTFWFVSYEGQREGVGIPTLAHVPSQADIKQSIANNGGVVNPVIASLLARNPWPAPNHTPDTQGNNLLASTQASNNIDGLIAKVDHHFTESNVLTARYYYGNGNQSFPLGLVGGGILPGFNTLTPATDHIASLSYTHVFSQKLLMELRAGYTHVDKGFFAQDQGFDPNTIGLNMGTGKQDFGLPQIKVNGFAPLGSTTADPHARTDNNTQLFNNYSYSSGKHILKFGYEFRRTFIDGFFDNGYRGSLNFSSLDSFIAGMPSGGQQAQGNSSRQTSQNNHSFYFQDNFHLWPHLSLNYGLRWEYFGVIGEDKDRFSILDAGGNLTLVHQLYPHDFKNFAPRLSLAWDIGGNAKTVLRSGWGLYYDAFSQDFFLGQLPFNTLNSGPAYNGIGPDPVTFSFTPATVIQPGVQVFAPSTFSANDIFTVDQELRTPYIQIFNLNLERELSRNLAVQVGYVGSQGRKLFRYVDINQVNPATGTAAFPNLGFVNQIQTSAASSYNSLQSSLKFKNWHGLTSSLNYTWSHSIDNASDGLDFVPNASQPDNSFRPDLERASSNFDMRQHLSWAYSYQIPGMKTWAWLTSGWETDGVLALSAGQPFNVNFFNNGSFNGSSEGFGRPDLVGNPFAGTQGPGQFLNLTAFQAPCTFNGGNCVPGTQHFGNVGRNAFIGPNFKNFDFSLAKSNKLSEKVQMQLRADFFNLFNHPNFANPLWPNFLVDVFQNGQDAQGRGKGFLPLTATSDVGEGDPYLGNGGPRNIQLGLRFSF
jgi:hypothetical protein